MFANRPLARCQERKEELLRQSAVQRRVLEQEAEGLRGLAGWVDRGVGVARAVRLAWAVTAPLTSGGASGRESRAFRVASWLAKGISLTRSLMAAWQSSRDPAARGDQPGL